MPVATGWKSGRFFGPDFGSSIKSIARKVEIGTFGPNLGSSINAGGDGVEEWANFWSGFWIFYKIHC